MSALYIGLKNVHIQNFGPIDENLELQEIIELLLYIPRIYYGRDYRKQLPKLKSNLFIRIKDKRSGTLHPFNESSLYKQVEMKNRRAPGIIKNENVSEKIIVPDEKPIASLYVTIDKGAQHHAPKDMNELKELDLLIWKLAPKPIEKEIEVILNKIGSQKHELSKPDINVRTNDDKRNVKTAKTIERVGSKQENLDLKKFPTPKGTKWEDVEIKITDPFEAQFKVGSVSRYYDITEIGFRNIRIKNLTPKQSWTTLLMMIVNGGEMRWEDKIKPSVRAPAGSTLEIEHEKSTNKTKGDISQIRKILKEFMDINDDPFLLYSKDKGWVLKPKVQYKIKPVKESEEKTLALHAFNQDDPDSDTSKINNYKVKVKKSLSDLDKGKQF